MSRVTVVEEAVAEALADALFVVDASGALVQWNARLAERLGYDDEALAAMDAAAFVAPDGAEADPATDGGLADGPDGAPTRDLLTRDGERVPHELRAATVTDDRTGERYRVVTARDVSGRLARERDLERYETIFETVTDGIYALDEDLRYTLVNEGLCRFYDRPREELLGSRVTDGIIFDSQRRLAAAMRERVVRGDATAGTVQATGETPDGETIHAEARYRLHPEPDGEYRGSIGVIRDVTERVEREQRLERQRDELETLARINELLLAVTRDLVETASREAVERTVCSSLAASPLYRFAWVGGRDPTGDSLRVRASAGVDRETGESGGGAADEREDGATDGSGAGRQTSEASRSTAHPPDRPSVESADVGTTGAESADATDGRRLAERALGTGELQVEAADPPDTGADAAAAGDVRSVAAVPLRHEETVYGVLVVGATHRDAFGAHERTGFETLGETVGFVFDALRSRELLFADRVVELAFDLAGAEWSLPRVSARLDCALSLDGYVASGTGWLLFLAPEGASPGDVAAAAAGDPDVERARVVGEGDDRRVEVVAGRASVLETLARAGAAVRSAVADGGAVRLVVEAPVAADVRELVELVRAGHPSADLRSVRERDRPPAGARMPEGVLDDLTDRQREALEAAYRAGYFAWPRDSTAEEVAAALDVTRPTLHAHLRKAQRTLLSALFEGRGG